MRSLARGSPPDPDPTKPFRRARAVDAFLVAHGQRYRVKYTPTDFGPIAVFTDLRPSLQPWQLGLAPEPGPA